MASKNTLHYSRGYILNIQIRAIFLVRLIWSCLATERHVPKNIIKQVEFFFSLWLFVDLIQIFIYVYFDPNKRFVASPQNVSITKL